MRRQLVRLACITLICALRVGAQVPPTTVQAPRGGPITIDGLVSETEWRAALRIEHPAGTVVRLLRDADHLYVGITSERQGFASLCIARNDDVHVLHASAALGAVSYRRNGDVWQSADTAFQYGMRSTALDDSARTQRAAYLAQHGWLASTVRMGNDSRSQEIQIALRQYPLPFSIALGRWLFSNNVESWPATITDHDGCFALQLVRGSVPQGLSFKSVNWVTVENR